MRLFPANFDQLLRWLLDLVESQAIEKERDKKFELNQISLSGSLERAKSANKDEEQETTC